MKRKCNQIEDVTANLKVHRSSTNSLESIYSDNQQVFRSNDDICSIVEAEMKDMKSLETMIFHAIVNESSK